MDDFQSSEEVSLLAFFPFKCYVILINIYIVSKAMKWLANNEHRTRTHIVVRMSPKITSKLVKFTLRMFTLVLPK